MEQKLRRLSSKVLEALQMLRLQPETFGEELILEVRKLNIEHI